MINKVFLLGRLGRDPELKTTPSGKAVCQLSVATDDFYNGEKQTEWHRVVVWEKQAETCAKYLKKGSQIYVEGKNKTRSWEQNGEKRYVTEVIAHVVKFLDRKEQKEDIPF